MMPVLGIDLGTTYACVAAYHDGKVDILTNDQEKRLTPAYIAFNDVERLYGNAAIKQGFVNMDNTVYGAKQLLGRCFHEPSLKRRDLPLGYNLVDSDNKPMIKVCYRKIDFEFFPEEVNAMILAQMKKIATQHFNKEITMAVISVPASFSDAQRTAIRDAGMIAGLNVLSLVNDPTAAAISYGMENKIPSTSLVLIFDLGGGTFDVSIAKIVEGGIFSVLATRGDTNFGGDNFDSRMVLHFMRDFNKRFGLDISNDRRAIHRLRAACEKAKRTLSGSAQASVGVDALFKGKDFDATISRETFEEINADLFEKAITTVKEVLQDIDVAFDTVDEILLVGGSTRIPKLREMLSELFNNKELNRMINPDEAVACGAAHLAGKIIGHQQFTMKDVTCYSYAFPSSIGEIEIAIHRNMDLPVKSWISVKEDFSPESPLTFKIFESKGIGIEENDLIGVLSLQESDSSTTSSTEVCFTIDSSGLLSICGYQDNKKLQLTFVDFKQKLPNKERERLCKIAIEFDQADEEWKKRCEAKNNLENYVYAVKKSVGQRKYKKLMSEEQKTYIMGKCDEILKWIENKNDPKKNESEIKQEQLENSWIDLLTLIDPDKANEIKLRKEEKQRRQLEALTALKDSVNLYKNTVEEAGYKEFCTTEEKSMLQWICDSIMNWLKGNTNADIQTIEKKKKEVEEIGVPIYQKLQTSHQAEQARKREAERRERDYQRTLLHQTINAVRNKIADNEAEISDAERQEINSKLEEASLLLSNFNSKSYNLKKTCSILADSWKKVAASIEYDRKRIAEETKEKQEKRIERRGALKDRLKNLSDMIKEYRNKAVVIEEENKKIKELEKWIYNNSDADIELIEDKYNEVDGLWRTMVEKLNKGKEKQTNANNESANRGDNSPHKVTYAEISSGTKKRKSNPSYGKENDGCLSVYTASNVDNDVLVMRLSLNEAVNQYQALLKKPEHKNVASSEAYKVISTCDSICNWLKDNLNASITELYQKKDLLEEICKPILRQQPSAERNDNKHDVSELSNDFAELRVTPTYSSVVQNDNRGLPRADNYRFRNPVRQTTISNNETLRAKRDLGICISHIVCNLDNGEIQLPKDGSIKLRTLCEDANVWMTKNPNGQAHEYATRIKKLNDGWNKLLKKLHEKEQKATSGPVAFLNSMLKAFRGKDSESSTPNPRPEKTEEHGYNRDNCTYTKETERYHRSIRRSRVNYSTWVEKDRLLCYRQQIFSQVLHGTYYRDMLRQNEKADLQRKDNEIVKLTSIRKMLEAEDYKKKREELEDIAKPIIQRLNIHL